jgi:KamA family protein
MHKFKSYNIRDLHSIPQLEFLSPDQVEDIKIVGEIYPFKTNTYVLNHLIDWDKGIDDPMFRLNFPHRDMLEPAVFDKVKWGLKNLDNGQYKKLINDLRLSLNPHPAGQQDLNVPVVENEKLYGVQHKYDNIVLFFPSNGQTCHAYCTFCFRWPQFVNEPELKIQAKEVGPLLKYLKQNRQITEVLITGGDPMTMNSKLLSNYIEPLLEIPSIESIRIGTKSLSFWPYKYTDEDSGEILNLMSRVTRSGKHLALMAHFNHWAELNNEVVVKAIENIRRTGAEVRTQAPLLRYINNSAQCWKRMLEMQVQLGCIPYYMFLPRDTGAQLYFAETLTNALQIFQKTMQYSRGITRTIRGPVMSVNDGKAELLDIQNGVYTLRYLRHRNPQLTYKLFQAKPLNSDPKWFDDLLCDIPNENELILQNT